jgi:molecular chaperone GrpE (heat shock protein)
MTLDDIQREIAALPASLPAPPGALGEAEALKRPAGPLQVVSKQGRLILRTAAAVEALETRTRELTEEAKAQRRQAEETTDALRRSERHGRQIALEAIHLMDALDWVAGAIAARGDEKFAHEIVSAQRDCLRRLAAVGITEIPAPRGSAMDGRLHEGLEALPAVDENKDIPQYHIVSLVRRGYQSGTDVLRRAGVATAA